MTFRHLTIIFIVAPSFLLISFVAGKIEEVVNEAIPSGGIKSDLGSCNFKKGPNGVKQEYCYIRNENDLDASKYFKAEQEKTGKSCKKFRLSDFSENSPSIMYGEAQGRLGNQLLGYAMLLQLGYVFS
jgi:hypothetical protein